MSPSRDIPKAATKAEGAFGKFGDLNLSIIGLGIEYPPHKLGPDALDTLVARHYPDTPAMKKILAINQYTGIDYRSAVELCKYFLSDAVPYAVSAAQKAITEAGIDISQITHVVSTTCTNSANPGYDHYVCKGLGITHPVEKVLLHGIGCSGGLASLRTAANLALGASFRGRPARLLVIALEVSSLLVRSELDSINELQEMRIGVTLFSDCASAVVLSNRVGARGNEEPVYELLGWDHRMIPETEGDLGFDVDPLGWKVVLSPRVPKLAASVVEPTFNEMMASLPSLPETYKSAVDFDWAVHPGGSTVLTGVERAMNLTPEHMRASYDTYINHGNSSSATIFAVMHRLREKDMDALATETVNGAKDYVVACAFGPGISIEMCVLKRNMQHFPKKAPLRGELTPDSESGSARVSKGEEMNQGLEALDGVALD